MAQTGKEIIRTLSAICRDCYRCVRACPVDAIGIRNNQAFVDHSRCIVCGCCVKACPQKAKVYRNDIEFVAELVQEHKVIASIAPSFSSIYSGWKAKAIPSALRKLGFKAVCETAEGALLVARHSQGIKAKSYSGYSICSSCPVVVKYIEKYYPEQVEKLIPIVSPMIAHARILKQRYGRESKVIFIGPCIAKKQEALRPEFAEDVDAVLTFSELDRWLAREGIVLEHCVESGFDNELDIQAAKLFALPGGTLKTMEIQQEGTHKDILATSGIDNIQALLDSPAEVLKELTIIEPLYCSEGCINGSGIDSEINLFQRRLNLITYTDKRPNISSKASDLPSLDLCTIFKSEGLIQDQITEEQIEEVFQQIGKNETHTRLDCGACGYSSCREKAKAVIRKMAEKEMCIPHMRILAEQRTDKIIETSPNGIVILDGELQIISMNSAFCQYFSCSNHIAGKKISYLLDAQAYEKLAIGTPEYAEDIITCYGKEFHQIVYRLPSENQYVGIYSDLSGIRLTEAKMEKIKNQTLERAQELLDHQIKIAQTLAKFLGDSTAHTEELVERLMKIYDS